MDKENIHSEHRKRLREIYLKEGINALSDIEVLEFLLFYSIPRKDTNPTAHLLLKEYKSFEALFQADIKSLEMVKGIGENSALLIKLISDINTRIEADKIKKGVVFSNPKVAGEYIKGVFVNAQHEMFYAFFLNKGNKLLGWEKLAEGSADCINVDTRKILKSALKYETVNVVLAHNHPGGSYAPSSADKNTTRLIATSLSLVGMTLKDHFIVANGEVFSFEEANLFKEDDPQEND